MTLYIISDVTTAFLRNGEYIGKLKLTAQAIHMQVTVILYRLYV